MKKLLILLILLPLFSLLFFSKVYAVGTFDASYLGGSSFAFSNFSSPTPSDLGLACGIDGYSYISGGPGNAYGGNFHMCSETGGTLAPDVYLPDGSYSVAWIASNGQDVWQSPTFSVSGMPVPSVTPTPIPTPTPTPTPYPVGTFSASYSGGSSFSFSAFSSPTPSERGLVCGVDGYSYISGGPGIIYGGNFHICDESGGTLASDVYLPDGYYEIAWIASNGHDVWQSPFFYVSGMPIPSITPTPTPSTLLPSADLYIKQGSQNENEGSSTFLRLQSNGHNRALVKFSQSQVQNAVGNSQNYTAKLRFTITDNGNNWGTTGRNISVHKLTSDWAEGNGFVDGNSPSNRGTGSGATWNCATDINITNYNNDCSGSTAWNMDNSSLWPFIGTATAISLITNNQSGNVDFDVTPDVHSFISGSSQNYGWIVKKVDEGQNGRVQFGSRETGNSPQLIITPQ